MTSKFDKSRNKKGLKMFKEKRQPWNCTNISAPPQFGPSNFPLRMKGAFGQQICPQFPSNAPLGLRHLLACKRRRKSWGSWWRDQGWCGEGWGKSLAADWSAICNCGSARPSTACCMAHQKLPRKSFPSSQLWWVFWWICLSNHLRFKNSLQNSCWKMQKNYFVITMESAHFTN